MARTGHSERWDRDPKVRSADILVWLYRTQPDQEFTARDVAQAFKMSEADARRRLALMRVAWGAIVRGKEMMKAHRRGRRQLTYKLTAWGKKYSARRVKEGARRRIAANPEE